MDRPGDLFDRDQEWRDISGFVTSSRKGPRLGIVHGRRRQGKSHLLRALVLRTNGLYHQALEEERVPALERVGSLVAEDSGLGGAGVTYPDWRDALRGLIGRAGRERPIVLDEFPYLMAMSPELPSVIQAAFDDARAGIGPDFRLLLCGSAMSIMSGLLSGQRALRGRAALDLVMRPFGFRTAAAFWGIADPETAFRVHAVVGGTPGYRELFDGAIPAGPGGYLEWLAATVLNPSHAMFHEAEYLLTEDPAVTDRALYQSVLAAIVAGRSTRNAVGGALGRDDSALRHPLLVLERAGFIRRDEDLFRAKRPLLRLADPYLRFHHAIVRPDLARWEARSTAAAWARAQDRLASNVLGPHFEQLARDWTASYASERTLGGTASSVGFTQLSDPRGRTTVEIDVVALDADGVPGAPRVLAVGKAKGGSVPRTPADLGRLERSRALLGQRADVSGARLLLFSRSGFDGATRREVAGRPDVELVDLARIYGGD
jgi:uncharacterized protein